MIKKNGVLYFDTFLKVPHLVHGFSTRVFGDMRPSHAGSQESLDQFRKALGVAGGSIISMDQVHGNRVAWVSRKDGGKKIDETDGLLSSDAGAFLGVVTADCVPVLLYDPVKKVVGAVHAGWRGLYKEIIKEAVGDIVQKGSDPKDIIAGIGPCIGACCYTIVKEHEKLLLDAFPQWKDFMVYREGEIFLDLAKIAYYQLRSSGIPATTIEEAGICTNDSSTDLFSCRREGKEFGEFVGVIGVKS